MGEVRLFGLELLNDRDSLIERKMGHMRGGAKCVEDQHIKSLQLCHALGWNIVRVGAVGDVADAETKHIEARPMMQAYGDHLSTEDIDGGEIERAQIKLRDGSGVGLLSR